MNPVPPRSFLFVPANRLDRIIKAVASGADAVVIDLEDAVANCDKDELREQIGECYQEWGWSVSDPIWLRINGVDSDEFDKDVALLQSLPVAGVLLPKVSSGADVVRLTAHTDKPIIAMIESGQGVLNIADIARSDVWAMSYGCLDLLTSLGVVVGSRAGDVIMDKIRTELVLHSAVNGLNPPIETIFADFHDDDGLAMAIRHWQDFGFGGQLFIHPKQITVFNLHYKDQEKLTFAKKVVETHDRLQHPVIVVDGKMVDLPVINWARDYVKYNA